MIEMGLYVFASPFFSSQRLDKTLICTDATLEALKKQVDSGRPTIIITLHTGMVETSTLIKRATPIELPEIGVIYRPINQKKLDDFVKNSRERHGCTLLSRKSGMSTARSLLKNKQYLAILYDQNAGKGGQLGLFMNRPASTTDLPQMLAHHYKADVVTLYIERTGLWEGNLHIEKIASGADKDPIMFIANKWLENKLHTDKHFCSDWLWVHDRWKFQNKKDFGKTLDINHRRNRLAESVKFLNIEKIPKTNPFMFHMPHDLGDTLKLLPFIKTIAKARPDAKISLLVNRAFVPLLESFRVADEIIPLPRRNIRYYFKLLKYRYQYPDTAFILTDDFASDLDARIINAARRYGIDYPGSVRPTLTKALKLDPGFDLERNHQHDLWSQLFKYFGLADEPDKTPLTIHKTSQVINPLRCLQTESNEAPYIGLICGAGNQTDRCWPVDYWVELVAAIMDLYPQSNICLFGSNNDLEISRKVVEQFEPGSIHNFTGSTNLLQFATAIQTCSVVISNDNPGLHLANTLGTPTIGLYGESNPRRTRPIYDAPAKIIQPIGCKPTGDGEVSHICISQILEALVDLVIQPDKSHKQTTLVS